MSTQTTSRRSRRRTKSIASSEDWDRRHMPGLQLHESEKLLTGAIIFLVILLPWALGSTHVFAQIAAAFFAVLTLGAALLPRHGDTHTITSAGQFKRLLAFPVFWLGLIFFGLLAVQGFNTSHLVEGTEGFRYLTEQNAISWLPAGIHGPFSESNPFRMLLIASIPFFVVCAAWVGLTRRKSVQMILSALAINGLLVGGLAFYQVAKGKSLILWFYEPPTSLFLGSFLYHWQGAAYLMVVMAAAIGMAAHHHARARKSFRRSNPSGLFIFIGLALMLVSVFSASRASAAFCGGIMAAFIAHVVYCQLTKEAPLSRKVFLIVAGVVFSGISMALVGDVADNYLERRHANRSVPPPIASSENWDATSTISTTLFKEKPIFGWGAGSFPHLYQETAERAEIEEVPESLHLEYAASDWFRSLSEIGIVGCLLLVLMGGYLLKFYCRLRVYQNPLVGFLLIGFVGGLALSYASPILQNAAFLTTWLLVLTLGCVLIRVETTAKSRGELDN